jgi:hypothetical protein
VIHLRANLEQAARFSIRVENKRAAETALRMIDTGTLKTRTQVKTYIEQALKRAKDDRIKRNNHN